VNSFRQKYIISGVATLTLFVLALSLAGCAYTPGGIRVEQLNSRSVLELSADNVVDIMRAAGFTDDQIIEHGTEVRDGLAQTGAVQIHVNRRVEAVFAAKDQDVYISTQLRGLFIYNIHTGWKTGNTMGQMGQMGQQSQPWY
jgi:hypothetical protein